jgi:hypothetical protein
MKGGRFSGRLNAKFNPFDDDYLAEIVIATASAWGRMKKPPHGELEDAITFSLVGRIKNDPEFRKLPYDVDAQYWLLGLNGERLGRLDVHFKHRHSRRDYFAFEAKRLHVRYPGGKRSTEYPTYVGDAGMMAFLVEQYSEGLPAAGMLAYVMDGKTDKAWEGLAKRIEARRKNLQLMKGTIFARSSLSKAVSGTPGAHLGETEHSFNKRRLRILHLILPV